MYSSRAPPLPPGRRPQQVVVQAEFSVLQPLWQNDVQLRKHLRELVEHAFLLKAVRIPGHWIGAPPPADAVWASYLVLPASKIDTTENAEPKKKKRKTE